MSRRSLIALLVLPLVVACSSAAGSPATGTAAPAPTGEPSPTSARPSFELSPPPFATVPPTSAPVTGEVPAPVLDQAKSDLAGRTGLDPATFTVLRAEQVIWADGSLGCPVPGQAYIQVVLPGYWIVLQADGTSYDYRAASAGGTRSLRLCDQPNPKPPSG